MPLGGVSVTSQDGGIGVRGPAGIAQWAAIGISSSAAAVATQEPLVITGPADAETQLGVGPLRDLMVAVLSTVGGSVLVMPLQRGSGGTPVEAGMGLQSTNLRVTPLATGHALGQQDVTLECVTGGAGGTAVFRLIVDGVPQPAFTPTAAQITAASYAVPSASLGSLADGVALADQLKVNIEVNTIGASFVTAAAESAGDTTISVDGGTVAIPAGARFTIGGNLYVVAADVAAAAAGTARDVTLTTPLVADVADNTALTQLTDFTAGDRVTFRMAEPKGTGADYTTAISKLVSHRRTWEFVAAAGTVAGATMALINTAVDIEDQGRYVFGVCQTVGHDLRTGAAAASTLAAWITATSGGIAGAPGYQDSPRLQIGAFHDVWDDPITGREKIWPTTYGYLERLVRRQPQEPAEAFRYGAKGTSRPRSQTNCKSIYGEPTEAQIFALDQLNFLTSRYHDGEDGVFVTRSRMWGQPAAPGVDGTDYSGSYRRRVLDEACRRARRAMREFFGDDVATGPDGRVAPGAIARIEGRGNGAISSLIPQAISAGRVTAVDTDPGILISEELQFEVSVRPRGFVGNLVGRVGFRISVGDDTAAA